jgi:hypothetical protein
MAKLGRNDICDCGSGKKYKKCCEAKTPSTTQSRVLMLTVGFAVAAAIVAGIASFTGSSQSTVRVWDPAHGHYHNENGVQVP